MFGQTFYHAIHRKYVILFGTLFNNIKIPRKNPILDSPDEILKVPITYSSHDKMLARVFGDPDLNRQAAAVTPAMSFEMLSPKYDPSRKVQSTLKMCHMTDEDGMVHAFMPIPYNIGFRLYIYAREEEDGLKVLEQILPYFTPALTITAEIVEEMGFTIDIPIVLDSVNFDNGSYGPMLDRRKLIWTLDFTLKGQFLGPVVGDRGIIRQIHINFRDSRTFDIMEEVHIQPGLTANGEPTSNSAESIPIDQINEHDNYGYVIDINEGPDPHP